MTRLNGRVALVTGAAGGIGRAVCARLLGEGAAVVASDIDGDGLDALVKANDSPTGALDTLRMDITGFEAVSQGVRQAVERHGAIDILVNNAGWDVARPFLETEPELWDKIIAINLRGALNTHKAVLPHMIEAGRGKIVNVASDAGRVGSSGEAVYSACKGGLIAFSKTMARETASKNIQINAVCPGPTDTALLRSFFGEGDYGEKLFEKLRKAIPMKRIGQPEDLAGAIAFLASDDSDFMTGQVFSVSGGLTMHG